jgi:hypothetical protein
MFEIQIMENGILIKYAYIKFVMYQCLILMRLFFLKLINYRYGLHVKYGSFRPMKPKLTSTSNLLDIR